MSEGTGNIRTQWTQLGASNHTEHDRMDHDYYATEPLAVELLMDEEQFDGTIWENCCGEGHLSKPMEVRGYTVISTDLIDRGFGQGGIDFFECTESLGDNIVTNPPYKFAKDWAVHSLELLKPGKKLALLLPIQFFESQERYPIFKLTPPRNRVCCSE